MAPQAPEIAIAHTDDEIRACFPVMRQLRPHLAENQFVARVRRQEREGFQLAFVRSGDTIHAVTGFRFLENLASGKILYVDDLVTHADKRSQGWGGVLLDWLTAQARARDCAALELDSGVQRFGAHRFYLRRRMDIVSHHFRLVLDE
jgi:GNAT superfamily N-acetyltransferase